MQSLSFTTAIRELLNGGTPRIMVMCALLNKHGAIHGFPRWGEIYLLSFTVLPAKIR